MFSFVGYKYHLDSAIVKPTQERWLKLQDLILRLKSKHVLTAICLMSLIGLLASTEKMAPERCLHMRPFQFHLKEHWRFPQLLDNLLPWTEMISHKHDERPSSQRPQYPTLYRRLKQRLGRSLRANLYKRSVVRQEKKAKHKCSRAAGSFSGPSKVQGPVSKPYSVGCYRQLNSSSLHKQGGTHSAEMCTLLWKIMTWCHHYQITLKARHIPGCLNVMANLLLGRTKTSQQNGHCIYMRSEPLETDLFEHLRMQSGSLLM